MIRNILYVHFIINQLLLIKTDYAFYIKKKKNWRIAIKFKINIIIKKKKIKTFFFMNETNILIQFA